MSLHRVTVAPVDEEWLVWCSRCDWSVSVTDFDRAMRERDLHSVKEIV